MQLPLFQLSPVEQQAWLRDRFERPAPESAINRSDGFRLPGREGMTKPAAVLIPLINRPGGLTVLFTERSVDLPDHPGQISFPGGRIEPEDADAVAAALREAEEEISLPRDRVRPLGRLADYETVTGFRVLPIVALLTPDYVARPDPREVDEVFEVPLDYLMAPANLRSIRIDVGGRPRSVLEFVDSGDSDRRIWGVSASILLNLRERLENLR
jgi:8-oxo-dGTP pyrophosphatase MutT (NUDIX family)